MIPIDLWRVALDGVDPERVAALRRTLAPEEQARAARFHFAHDRERFIVGRAALRRILAETLSAPNTPQSIRFRYNAHGKPEMDEKNARVAFNVSHSDGTALIAVAEGCAAVGVDIEKLRRDFDPDEIAPSCLSPQERQRVRDAAPNGRHAAFLDLWTRKEAYVKARGEGLSLPTPLWAFSIDDVAKMGWSVTRLELGSCWVGALAIRGKNAVVDLRRHELIFE